MLAIRAFGEAHVAEKLAKAAELREKRQRKAAGKVDRKKGRVQEVVVQGAKGKRKSGETEGEGVVEQPAVKKNKVDRIRYVFLIPGDCQKVCAVGVGSASVY